MFGNPDNTLLLCANEWFRSNEELQKEFELYTKTEKYLRHNGDSAQGTREKTLNNFRSRNTSLKEKIVERLNRRFPETRVVSVQQIIDPSEINGTKPSERFANMLHKKKVREFEYRGQPRYPLEHFVSKALITSEREVLIVKQGEAIPSELIESARSAFREIFNTEPSAKTDGNELYEALHKEVAATKQNISEQAESYLQYPFRNVFHAFHTRLDELVDIRDPKRFFETLNNQTDELKQASDQCKQLDGFLVRTLPEYDKMKKFLELNADNLSSLDAANREKIEWLTNFFTNEDPTADFRTARKTYSELNGAINQLLKSLHQEAEKTYNEVFDSLEAEANKKDVPLSAFAVRSHKLESLKRLNSISSLRLAIKDAGSFKSQQLDTILKEVNRQQGNDKAEEPPVHYKPGGNNKFSVISNQQELDEYLAEVRNEMEKILKENKKIILE